jgi:putative flippase GtrA
MTRETGIIRLGLGRLTRLGLIAQGMRFAVAGVIVMLVYLLTTLLLSAIMGLPFQIALISGFSVALVTHFTLQRLFVWAPNGEFALPFKRQLGRYLLVAVVQYVVTAASTALLPSALGVPTEVVYVVVVVIVTSTNFLVFRNGVFHTRPPDPGRG